MTFDRIMKAPSFYPVTGCYIAGVIAIVVTADGYINFGFAILCFALAAVLILLLDMQHEVKIVHHIVDSQTDALLRRIDQLTDALVIAGIEIPELYEGVSDGRPDHDKVEAV